jgi:hypothetical protein
MGSSTLSIWAERSIGWNGPSPLVRACCRSSAPRVGFVDDLPVSEIGPEVVGRRGTLWSGYSHRAVHRHEPCIPRRLPMDAYAFVYFTFCM